MKHKLIDVDTGEIVTPFMRTQYNYDRDKSSEETATICETETRTQQQFKDECDINVLMRKFGVTGELPQLVRPVMPDEYSEVFDFQSAMNVIRKAEEAFMQMPSGIRARFQNNPQIFTEFFANEDNRIEAEKMGLLVPRQPKTDPLDAKPGGTDGKGPGGLEKETP